MFFENKLFDSCRGVLSVRDVFCMDKKFQIACLLASEQSSQFCNVRDNYDSYFLRSH